MEEMSGIIVDEVSGHEMSADVGSASIGFLIVSAALVFVMTPGVGIFPLS